MLNGTRPVNTIWWILACLVPAVKGSLTASPSNVVGLMGSERALLLNCSTNITSQNRYVPVQWSVMFLNSSIQTLTTRAGSINPIYVSYYNVTDGNYTGQFNLGIISTDNNTAGRYTCVDRNGIGAYASSEVIILEPNPVCNLTQIYYEMDRNQVIMLCSVTYYGFWAPRMQWSLLGGSNQSSVDVTTKDTVTSILTINTTSSMDGQQYICKTFFSQQSSSNVTASNIPAYNYTWKAGSLKTYVSTQNISISPDQILYNPGETIRCNASGYPAPAYQWKDLNDGSSVDSSQLVINESMVGRNLTYQCTARNVIQGNYYSSSINKTFSVPCPEFCTITSSGNELTCNIPYGRNYSWYSESTWLHSGPIYITNISSISCLAVVNDNCSLIRCTNVTESTEKINQTSTEKINPVSVNGSVVGAVVGGVVGSLIVIAIILIVVCLLRRKKCLKNNEREKSNGKEEIIPYSRHTLLVEDRNDEREHQGERTRENIPNIPNYTQVDKFQKRKKNEEPPDLITNTQGQYATVGMNNQAYEEVGMGRMEPIKPIPKQTVGELDGTVYQDLNLSKSAAPKLNAPKPKPAAPAVNADTTGNYASIDHLQIHQ